MTPAPKELSPSSGTTWGWAMGCALEQVRPAAAAARAFLQQHGVAEAEAEACELALVEACNNAVLYAQPERRAQPIALQIFYRPGAVEFHVTDHTPGFDWPAEVNLPAPDAEHGRGLF